MRVVEVIVDSHLRVDGNPLGHDLAGDIFDELTIPNAAKEVAKRQKRYQWWEMPDDFLLGDLDGDTLVLPRGYAARLKAILREHDIKVVWKDRRKCDRGEPFKWAKRFTARPQQPRAVKKFRRYEQGMYQAPTGSGKSLTCILFIQEVSPHKTIILTDQLGLLSQWRKDIAGWLGIEVGQIGSGKWDDNHRITVATVQTIWKRVKDGTLPEGWFDEFDCAIVDECHHVTADTIQHIVGQFSAKWRIGVSATPDRLDQKFEIAKAVLGPIFHEDNEEDLIRLGVLIRPEVRVIKTDFKFQYWGDHESDDDGNCSKPGCKIWKKHSHRNNYQALKDEIVTDWKRNSDVASEIRAENEAGDHHHLIISDEIRHLDALEPLIEADIGFGDQDTPVFRLTGKVSGKKRAKLIEEIAGLPKCIVLATVAKEGLDIPRVDRIYLPFPASNPKKVQQWVGRGTRVAEGKGGCLIFDFLDINVGILKKQFRNRRYGFYDKKGIKVVK